MAIQVIPPMTADNAQMIADEGAHKLRRYGCERAIVIHKWRAYIVERKGDRIEIYSDIDDIVAVITPD